MAVTTEQIGVLLIDDDRFARRGLRAVLEEEPSLTVVGEAEDCTDALALVDSGNVRVVVSGVSPRGRDCLRLLQELSSRSRDVAVIALGRSDSDNVLSLVQAGVGAYLDRTVPPDELIAAIRNVARGGHLLDPQALSLVLRDYGMRCGQGKTRESVLTPRERQVLTLVAEGSSTREIAEQLVLSPKTVEVHRRRIMDKLDLRKVADLVRYALREGLVSLEAG